MTDISGDGSARKQLPLRDADALEIFRFQPHIVNGTRLCDAGSHEAASVVDFSKEIKNS